MRRRRISSPNADYQLALSLLANRRQRQRQGRFVVEGVRAINGALEHGWGFESVWYDAGRDLSAWARGVIERGATAYAVEPGLFAELSGKEQPSELVALARMPPDDLSRIELRRGLVLAFDRPVSPGNLGSVLRSCEALGADGLVVTGHAADPYDPLAVRASMGAVFAVPVVRVGAPAEAAGWARSAGLRVLGSSARGESPIDDADLTRPALLAVGNETRGLSEAWRSLCDELLLVPMSGSATSLNAAAAAAILLYEAVRQRRRAGIIDA